jgi:hypothetical protein
MKGSTVHDEIKRPSEEVCWERIEEEEGRAVGESRSFIEPESSG